MLCTITHSLIIHMTKRCRHSQPHTPQPLGQKCRALYLNTYSLTIHTIDVVVQSTTTAHIHLSNISSKQKTTLWPHTMQQCSQQLTSTSQTPPAVNNHFLATHNVEPSMQSPTQPSTTHMIYNIALQSTTYSTATHRRRHIVQNNSLSGYLTKM